MRMEIRTYMPIVVELWQLKESLRHVLAKEKLFFLKTLFFKNK